MEATNKNYIDNNLNEQKIGDILNNTDKKRENANRDQSINDTSKKTAIINALWTETTKHPFITIAIISGVFMLGQAKLTQHIISRGVYMGNIKTIKSMYRILY